MADSDAMPNPPRAALLIAAVLLPPLVLAALLAAWGVDLPYWDQFALVPHFADRAAGDFHLLDLWTPHNEHRLFIPQAIMMTLAAASGWNVLWELWFQYGLTILTLALLLSLLRESASAPGRASPPDRDRVVAVGVPCLVSLMVFSPVQWRNWIWGWQIQIFLVALAAVATVWLLTRIRAPGPRLSTAALAATVGSLSFANGLLLWPLALPLVALGGPAAEMTPKSRRNRLAWVQAAVWALVGAAVWAVYFHDFAPGVDHGPEAGLWRRFLHFGAYVVLYLAAPMLRFHDQTALWGGFVIVSAALAVLAWAVWRTLCRRDLDAARRGLPWWTLSAFAVSSAAVTALGRLDLGIGQALSSRYVTIGNLFWLGLVGWLMSRRPTSGLVPTPRLRTLVPPLLAACLVALLVNAAHGIYHFQRDSQARRDLRRQILEAGSPQELRQVPLQFIHPSAEEAAHHLETLRDLEIGPYRP